MICSCSMELVCAASWWQMMEMLMRVTRVTRQIRDLAETQTVSIERCDGPPSRLALAPAHCRRRTAVTPNCSSDQTIFDW